MIVAHPNVFCYETFLQNSLLLANVCSLLLNADLTLDQVKRKQNRIPKFSCLNPNRDRLLKLVMTVSMLRVHSTYANFLKIR